MLIELLMVYFSEFFKFLREVSSDLCIDALTVVRGLISSVK